MRDFHESRTYVQHLLAEHRRLHKMLQMAHVVIREAGQANTPDWQKLALRTLREVREELVHHFAEEEQGGCMEEAASHCPILSPELRRIEAEHPMLLAEVDRLIAQVADGRESAKDRVAIAHAFQELCRDLHAHEAAENELLRRGFGTNVNGDECDVSTTDDQCQCQTLRTNCKSGVR